MRVACVSLISLVLAAQSYPPPFPRAGATRLIENERVVVWDVTWPKGQPTPMHRHPRDLVGVFLADGSRVITAEDGTKTPSVTKAGQAVFAPKGVVHIEEGTSDQPARAILLELSGDRPSGVAATGTNVRPAFPREGAKQLLDNERVTVWDYQWTTGATVPLHHHTRDAVIIWFENGKLQSNPASGAPSEIVAAVGQARYAPRGTVHSETVTAGTPRAIVVELK